ncbi:acyltransferase family protein [Leptospira yasudae]|uniref:acyltransferase family protein n=1 Tax=Leptospira yasudae TaxID=2202201 RepID=UPI001090E49C|nr:acyltransferase [Leptospira yasudae]MBW0433547.1 acyltransferase [Leptospira yasudae]TGN00512.1 acyltransferase [Leptospira yasudae]
MNLKDYFLSIFKKKENEYENLNGIRALSILSVVVFHGWVTAKTIIPGDADPIRLFLGSLSSGVDFFFLLSGFLIYGGLFRENERNGKIDIKQFFIKRSLRIFPAYYVALAVLYYSKHQQLAKLEKLQIPHPQVLALIADAKSKMATAWIDVFYFSDFYPISLYNGGWSLSIEEHFYMILPFLCVFFLFKANLRTRFVFYLLGFITAFLVRMKLSFPADIHAAYLFYARFDSILAGMVVYEIFHYFPMNPEKAERNKIVNSIIIIFGIFLVIGAHQVDPGESWPLVFRPIVLSLGFGILMYYSFYPGILKNLFSLSVFRPFARLGYAGYLWHIFAIPLAAKKIIPLIQQTPTVWMYLLCSLYLLLITFLISWFSYLLIEQPFLLLKDKLTGIQKKIS